MRGECGCRRQGISSCSGRCTVDIQADAAIKRPRGAHSFAYLQCPAIQIAQYFAKGYIRETEKAMAIQKFMIEDTARHEQMAIKKEQFKYLKANLVQSMDQYNDQLILANLTPAE